MTAKETAIDLPTATASAAPQILRDLVAIRTDDGEGEGVAYVAEWCRRHGFAHEVQSLDGQPLNVVASVGDGSRSLMFNAHIDTVPPGDRAGWDSDPYQAVERDGFLFGRGAVDDKGCLAAMMAAFEALAGAPERLGGKLILAAVGAEERGGLGTKLLVQRGPSAEAAIVGEATALRPLIAHKGCLRVWVTVHGVAAHASRPDLGVNSILGVAPVISALDELSREVAQRSDPLTGTASLVLTTLHGGTALNMVPDRCVLSIDRRLVPQELYDDALAEIDDALAGVRERHGVRCEREVHRFIAPSRTSSDEFIALVRRHAEAVTGRDQAPAGLYATCDMSFLANDGQIPTLILGPGDVEEAHQYNEKLDLAQLHLAEEVYRGIALDWLSR
jgi:acetylornithine deacetylase/succinyl-diaminopimelate desuccinylase family protein